MLNGIKNRIDSELRSYAAALKKSRRLQGISSLLHGSIAEFILRPGKRIRPMLFVLGYLSFRRSAAPGLYTSALAFELLHDFMLVHDDIIDRSDVRRGRPAMHAMLGAHFKTAKKVKFSGQDLAIVIGDILFAMAMEAFLTVKERPQRKEAALKRFIEAAFYTGCGEFAELELGTRPLEKIKESDIYRIYDLKTAYYSFAYPLSIGAALAGAPGSQVRKMFRYGVCLGRAFQIKDDVLGMFADESQTGKSALSDLTEGKRTLLIWHAFRHSPPKLKKEIKRLLEEKTATANDLSAMRILLVNAGAVEYAHAEIRRLSEESTRISRDLRIPLRYKALVSGLSRTLIA